MGSGWAWLHPLKDFRCGAEPSLEEESPRELSCSQRACPACPLPCQNPSPCSRFQTHCGFVLCNWPKLSLYFDVWLCACCLSRRAGGGFLYPSLLPICAWPTGHAPWIYLLNKWSVILGIHWYLSGRVSNVGLGNIIMTYTISQELENFFLKGQVVSILGIVGPIFYFVTQLWHYRAKITIVNR